MKKLLILAALVAIAPAANAKFDLNDYGHNCKTEFQVEEYGDRNVMRATDTDACPHIYWEASGICEDGCSDIRGFSNCVYGNFWGDFADRNEKKQEELKKFAAKCASKMLD